MVYSRWDLVFQVLSKTLRVDHAGDYKPPKDSDKLDDETRRLHEEGCAPKAQLPIDQIKRETEDNIVGGVRLPPRLPISRVKAEPNVKTEQPEKVCVASRQDMNHS